MANLGGEINIPRGRLTNGHCEEHRFESAGQAGVTGRKTLLGARSLGIPGVGLIVEGTSSPQAQFSEHVSLKGLLYNLARGFSIIVFIAMQDNAEVHNDM